MSVRPSKIFNIFRKDLKNGSIRKKEYKDIVEYWIYKYRESAILNPIGEKILSGDKYLYAIIACGRSHITSENENKLEIEGIRFKNDLDGNDLDDYLKKTKRGKNG